MLGNLCLQGRLGEDVGGNCFTNTFSVCAMGVRFLSEQQLSLDAKNEHEQEESRLYLGG